MTPPPLSGRNPLAIPGIRPGPVSAIKRRLPCGWPREPRPAPLGRQFPDRAAGEVNLPCAADAGLAAHPADERRALVRRFGRCPERCLEGGPEGPAHGPGNGRERVDAVLKTAVDEGSPPRSWLRPWVVVSSRWLIAAWSPAADAGWPSSLAAWRVRIAPGSGPAAAIRGERAPAYSRRQERNPLDRDCAFSASCLAPTALVSDCSPRAIESIICREGRRRGLAL